MNPDCLERFGLKHDMTEMVAQCPSKFSDYLKYQKIKSRKDHPPGEANCFCGQIIPWATLVARNSIRMEKVRIQQQYPRIRETILE